MRQTRQSCGTVCSSGQAEPIQKNPEVVSALKGEL